MCVLNGPGSWHDSRVARAIYRKLDEDVPEGYFIVADTAFPRGTIGSASKIKAPLKAGQALPRGSQERAALLAFDRQLVSYRQSVEWGMRTLQGSFGRLRLPLDANNDEERGDLLEICSRLSNVRTLRVGINQIRNVYVPIWKQSLEETLWESFSTLR